ncbi:MAG: putative rRNA maturation factor [Parcubacteria group bacterium GW2011_GWA2_53_21]|nr:MAG: putative rRNA maturation factor [Parcubacteria group bacterium GW2011_GWA2_53_21]
MLTIFYRSTVVCPISRREVERIASLAARQEKKIKGQIDITVMGDAAIRSLNKRYRGKNQTTDVLSFAWGEDQTMPSAYLGQVYLSYPQIRRQARAFQASVKEEFARMLVHGLLHIAGHDHVRSREAKRMFSLQEKIIAPARLSVKRF